MADLVEILVTAKNLTGPAFAEAKAGATGMESAMSKVNKIAAVGATAMIGFGVEAVKMASKFDSEMSLLSTQAGVSQDKIAGLSKGVLALSGKVAQDPDSLAESLFHVESNFESMGITSEKALKLTETAAKGATVGHANLVDVTNALTAAVASGIPGVQDFDQAMGVLNATVGVGDMKMQDLAAAFGSGMVATVKGFGLNITDVGAALAVFGDNNIRGAAAGTQLRMSVMALAKPVATAGDTLKQLGITQTTLAEDMRRGGLKLALEDLRDRMKNAGITADQQGQVITEAFGRKAGAGLNVLMSQMDRFESKYPALEEGAHNFAKAWEQTTHTFAFQMKSLEEKLNALMISVGERLIPKIQALIGFLKDHKDATIAVAEATGGLLAGIMAFSAATKIIGVFQALGTAVKVAGDLIVMARVRLLELQEVSIAAGGGLKGLGAAFSEMGMKAKLAVAATGIGLALVAVQALSELGKKAPPNIDAIGTSLGNLARDGRATGELANTFGAGLENLGYAVDRVAGKTHGMDRFNDAMNRVFSLGTMKSNSMDQAIKQIDAVDEGLANLVKSGNADLAVIAVKRLDDELAKQGKKPEELNSQLHKYNNALGDLDLAQKLTADSMGAMGGQAVETTRKLDAQALTAKGLKEAIIDLNDANRSALNGMIGFEASIDAATKTAKDNGKALEYRNGQLDLTTEKSRAEATALTDLAAKTDAVAEATLKNGGTQDQVNAIYDRGREKLIAAAEQMGLTSDKATELADSILHIPDRTVTVTADIDGAKRKLKDVETELEYASGPRMVHLLAEKEQLERVLADAHVDLDSLHDKHINITASFQSRFLDAGQEFAHGGIVGAATGGAHSGLRWVGEHGPELVRLPPGTMVHSNPDSQRMVGGGGGGAQKVVIELNSGGSRMDDLLLEVLRHTIRIKGGNVQTVLGQ